MLAISTNNREVRWVYNIFEGTNSTEQILQYSTDSDNVRASNPLLTEATVGRYIQLAAR